jgi:hypothetical protein
MKWAIPGVDHAASADVPSAANGDTPQAVQFHSNSVA